MNIFALDFDSRIAAQMHYDKHVLKMIVEYAQLLSTYLHVKEYEIIKPIYKATHINHPSNKWLRESPANYLWLLELAKSLVNEYEFRYPGKEHKTKQIIFNCEHIFFENVSILEATSCPMTPFAKAMPNEFKTFNSVDSYRRYYINDKAKKKMIFTKRKPPEWLIEKTKCKQINSDKWEISYGNI